MSFIAALALSAALSGDVATLHKYDGLSLSPDGKTLATFESAATVGSVASVHSLLTLRDTSGKIIATNDPCAECKYDALAWSPDSLALAFLAADRKSGVTTLYVLEGKTARVVTTIKGNAGRPRWSPDGKTLAVLATVGARKETGATQAGAALVGEIGVAGAIDEQRIATVPAAGGDLSFVSPADTWVYEYSWLPDGSGFVGTAAKGDGDNNWWTAKLEAFGRDGSERVIAAPKLQMNMPKVSPDGQNVLFIGGLMSDFGVVGGDVYSVPLTGGELRNLTADYKASFTSLSVTKSGVLATLISGGDTGVARIDPLKGGVSVLSSGPVSSSAGEGRMAFDAAGTTAAAVVESFTQAPRIAFGKPGDLKPVTSDNDAVTVSFSAKSVTWTHDGYEVQGWLLAPADVEKGKTYPMVTIVHGGPASAVTPRFSASGSMYELLKGGYYIFQPNPRGSFGQGQAFTRANVRDFGGADLGDILSGIDAVERIAPVDDKRLGVFGHSYGGFMTMWTVTHSKRFKAAVAGAGIANWISYYGQNGIDQWMIPFFGASAYDDPAIYDKLSPIRYIKNAVTPTFIYVGERDVECPPAQSMEMWHGLKAQGVPTSLVIYEGEGHGIRKPEHIRDLNNRITGWFDTYLK
ncbi:S9 family peptidase [Asticcacaulis benevestitus]|uniref:S9 family peptidase n=1 Tax=Asticcacaulis benevestitus TaxID=347481 RepID=UPI0003A016C6|nr:S9 family peptidase [Asticcacaulis benevestitus]